MSLFRKPKKIQRRVFSSNADEDDDASSMDIDGGNMETIPPPPPIISLSGGGKREKEKTKKSIKQSEDNGIAPGGTGTGQHKAKALLSFADDGECGVLLLLLVND